MDVFTLTRQQESLQAVLVDILKVQSPRHRVTYLSQFLEGFRSIVASLSRCGSVDIVIRDGIATNLLKMCQIVVGMLGRVSRADMEDAQCRRQAILAARLLDLLFALNVSDSSKLDILIVGISHLWRLLFCHADGCMDTSADMLRLRSTHLHEFLPLVLSVYSSLECGESVLQLCYIMLEVFRHSDITHHISSILTALAHVPKGVDLVRVYPGVVSRIVVNLPCLRESDFSKAMHVLESWIVEMLGCECTGPCCRKGSNPTFASMACKTSEAVCHIFSKYSFRYSQHMVGLCSVCFRCGCLSPEAFHQLHLFVLHLLCEESSWTCVRDMLVSALITVKMGLWREVTSCLRSQSPESLKVYLGYMFLLDAVTGLEELDDYLTMELMYRSIDTQCIDYGPVAYNFGGVTLCDEVIDMGTFLPPSDTIFTRMAARHIGRMPEFRQQQCLSSVLNYLVDATDDDVTMSRLLTLLHGFLMCGSLSLQEVVSDVVDMLIVRILCVPNASTQVVLCALSVLQVAFDLYTVDVPQSQICDILFWTLSHCVSGFERIVNQSRMLVCTLSSYHARCSGAACEVGVEPLLQHYKNLMVSRCVRELRMSSSDGGNVASVLYVYLCYKKLGVKDLFDLALELDRFCQPPDSVGSMPNLNDSLDPCNDVQLFGLYCYAFIARYIDSQFDMLSQPQDNMAVPSMHCGIYGSNELIRERISEGSDVKSECNSDGLLGLVSSSEAYSIDSPDAEGTVATSNQVTEDTSADSVDVIGTRMSDYKDKRLAVATLIATRCRYHLCAPSTEARHVALFALHRCINAFSHNVPVLRIRLYESWDPLFVCMDRNMRNLRIMSSIFGILRIAVVNAYDFVERWLLDLFERLIELLVDECSVSSVTNADEANRSIRFKFSVAMLEFVLEVSSRVVSRVLLSKLLVIALLMCRCTSCSVEKLAGGVLVNLFHKNPPLIRNTLAHLGSSDEASAALLRFALKRELRHLLPQSSRLLRLLPLSLGTSS